MFATIFRTTLAYVGLVLFMALVMVGSPGIGDLRLGEIVLPLPTMLPYLAGATVLVWSVLGAGVCWSSHKRHRATALN